MKNVLVTLAFVLSACAINAQERLMTRTGTISFLSETPIENIEAKSSQVASIFDTGKNVIAFNVLLKSFKFDKALMEEHFNEKYVHSDEYPAAKFKGSFDVAIDRNTPQTYENVALEGTMIFHGVSKPVMVKADVTVNDDKTIGLASEFTLKLADYNIEVPSIVKEKIAADIEITLVANYK